ncbi:MAG: ABC transporter substrate-binding protein [Cyclobacteriaceae bacterium]|nr:ABC transporter substrate-binding protein [Cyclobacteriaceae bacterium]
MPGIFRMIFFILLTAVISCRSRDTGEKNNSFSPLQNGRELRIDHSTRFAVTIHDSFKKLKVMSPWPGSADTFTYILYRQKTGPSTWNRGPDLTEIRLPVRSMVCFSTTHLPYLEMLGAEDKLTGFPTTDYISSEVFRERVEAGKIRDLGPSNEINFEQLLDLNPDIVIAFSMNNDISMINKIKRSGIPVLFNADYLENHPLGRAEWIKFFAAILDREEEADSIFSRIESGYSQTRQKMNLVDSRPGVFTGVVYGDTWFMPGGQNYGSIFIRDAGADYIWAENPSREILQLSFESVYEKARNAGFWVGLATYKSLKEIRQADQRYMEFKAYRLGNVYNYTARQGKEGGNAYFEQGYARPDLILNDLAKIFHPELMRGHELYFYEKLF